MFGGIRVDDDVPGVAGGPRGGNDQHPRSTAPLRFLVLVGPATVVGHRLAAEEVRLGRRGRRIIHENEKNFPANVGVFIVVPLVFGRRGSVADEYQLTMCAAGFSGRAWPDDDVV